MKRTVLVHLNIEAEVSDDAEMLAFMQDWFDAHEIGDYLVTDWEVIA